jgi:alpha-mannosidase
MPIHTAAIKRSEEQPLHELDDALGVVQHHDAVSGTAKQHVADDYSKRVQAGMNTASDFVAEKLKTIMLNASDTALTDLSYCQLLNETICDVSEVCRPFLGGVFPWLYFDRSFLTLFFRNTQRATISNDTDVYAIIYNPLASNRSAIIRLPLSSQSLYRVHRIENVIQSSAVPYLQLGDATK